MLDNIANIFNNNQTILEYQKLELMLKQVLLLLLLILFLIQGLKILINLTLKGIMLKLIPIKMIIRQV